jgi:very-short-patch-repair endonuclease
VDEAAVLALAARQHGLVAFGQMCALGFDDKAIGWRVRRGRLARVHPGVYRVAGAPVTREQRLLAPCLAAGEGSAVSHRSAAHEWGLAEFPDVIEIVTPRAQWPRLSGVRVHRSHDLRSHHLTVRHGIPITKPLRTLVDLGQSAPWAVADALETGLANRLFGIKAADAALDEFGRRGRTGVGIFRRIMDSRALERGIPDGLLEPRMARLMRNHGLPAASFQHWVTPKIRVDFAYPELKIAIEVDGFSTRRTPAALDLSNARQNELVMLGWTVVRFSWKQVVRQPEVVAKTILVTVSPSTTGSP